MMLLELLLLEAKVGWDAATCQGQDGLVHWGKFSVIMLVRVKSLLWFGSGSLHLALVSHHCRGCGNSADSLHNCRVWGGFLPVPPLPNMVGCCGKLPPAFPPPELPPPRPPALHLLW